MTTAHHTPHAYRADLTSAEVNRPLGELDSAIESVIATGSGTATTLTAQANAGQASLTVASSAGFAVGDPIYIGTGATFESRIIATVPDGVTITVTVNLSNTYAIGKSVSKSPVEIVDARGSSTTLGGRIGLIESRVFDVRQYGALGDGVTDDTAAFQAAHDNAVAGSAILVPQGTYLLQTALALTKALDWIGLNATLKAGADNLDAWFAITGASGWTLRGFKFDDDDRARTIISLSGCSNFVIEDNYFTGYSATFGHGATDSAIRISTSTNGKVRGNTFENFGGAYGPTAATLNRCVTIDDAACNRIIVTDNILKSVCQGFVVNGTSGLVIANNVIDTAGDNGIYVLSTVQDLAITGNHFKACEEAVVLSGGTGADWLRGVRIQGNYFTGSTNKHIAYSNQVEGVTISGNVFGDCTGGYIAFRSTSADEARAWLLTGNTFLGTTAFAIVYPGTVTDSLISDNIFRIDGDTAGWSFIRVAGNATGMHIVDNIFDDTGSTQVGSNRLLGTNTDVVVARNQMHGGARFDPYDAVVMRDQVWSNTTASWLSAAKKYGSGAAAPTAQTWSVGDIIFNTAPAAAGTVGWVCTTAGTPGTWKTFGVISA